eukprot:1152111-Prymnesium_polylepis.1
MNSRSRQQTGQTQRGVKLVSSHVALSPSPRAFASRLLERLSNHAGRTENDAYENSAVTERVGPHAAIFKPGQQCLAGFDVNNVRLRRQRIQNQLVVSAAAPNRCARRRGHHAFPIRSGGAPSRPETSMLLTEQTLHERFGSAGPPVPNAAPVPNTTCNPVPNATPAPGAVPVVDAHLLAGAPVAAASGLGTRGEGNFGRV